MVAPVGSGMYLTVFAAPDNALWESGSPIAAKRFLLAYVTRADEQVKEISQLVRCERYYSYSNGMAHLGMRGTIQ